MIRHFDGQTSTWRDQLLDIRPGDVAVLFDIRRYQSDLVQLGELLVERKARILLITDPVVVADRPFGPRGAALRGRCRSHLGFEHRPDGGRRSYHRPGIPRAVGEPRGPACRRSKTSTGTTCRDADVFIHACTR
jgi:hypothetical protein